GKENGVNILKSIDEGPFQMGTVWEPLIEGTEGAPHLGPERPRVYSDLSPKEKIGTMPTYGVDRIEVRGSIYRVVVQLGMGEFKTELGILIHVKQDRLSATTATIQAHSKELNLTQAFTELQILQRQDVADASSREWGGIGLDDCDAFDSDVDEAPTAQTMFMSNLSYEDPVTDEAEPSYDSDIQSEGIQKALTKEINEMKDVFEELEVEIAQNVIDRKHDAIERKNLLIANDNLIAECLSKEVFSVATNSELNVA
nr:integrase, catalytic region, zinc finger, CCHC-type, peptidase aspartic, catalytic [Tanacetum cinerariifolium]